MKSCGLVVKVSEPTLICLRRYPAFAVAVITITAPLSTLSRVASTALLSALRTTVSVPSFAFGTVTVTVCWAAGNCSNSADTVTSALTVKSCGLVVKVSEPTLICLRRYPAFAVAVITITAPLSTLSRVASTALLSALRTTVSVPSAGFGAVTVTVCCPCVGSTSNSTDTVTSAFTVYSCGLVVKVSVPTLICLRRYPAFAVAVITITAPLSTLSWVASTALLSALRTTVSVPSFAFGTVTVTVCWAAGNCSNSADTVTSALTVKSCGLVVYS